jgi:hypothetical protein
LWLCRHSKWVKFFTPPFAKDFIRTGHTQVFGCSTTLSRCRPSPCPANSSISDTEPRGLRPLHMHAGLGLKMRHQLRLTHKTLSWSGWIGSMALTSVGNVAVANRHNTTEKTSWLTIRDICQENFSPSTAGESLQQQSTPVKIVNKYGERPVLLKHPGEEGRADRGSDYATGSE